MKRFEQRENKIIENYLNGEDGQALSFLKSPRYPQDIYKISPRYLQDIPKISPSYSQDISKISPRYAQDIPMISPRYIQDVPQISPIYPPDMPKLCPKYPQHILNISPNFLVIQRVSCLPKSFLQICFSSNVRFHHDLYSCNVPFILPVIFHLLSFANTRHGRFCLQASSRDPPILGV